MALPIPGLRHKVYLAGHEFSHPPVSFGRLRPGVLESVRRLASGKAIRYVASPFAGVCDRPSRYAFSIGWDAFDEHDAAAFEAAIAAAGETDFCPWLSRAESFTFLAGESYGGSLQRRDALTQCPILPSSTVGLAPRLEIDGVTATLTLGSPDSEGRTPWSATGTVPAGGSTATIWYMPLYRVLLTESDEQPDTLQRIIASCALIEV